MPPIVTAFVLALVGGWAYLRWAPRRVLDIPNERSSHTRPTPRGGGIVIVFGFFAGLLVWRATGGALSPRALGWLGGAVIVAGVSFIDDLHPLPAAPRLVVHALAALGLAVVGAQDANPLLVALAFVYVVVLTNVYNFMDGIDGLAATQAVVAGVALAIVGLGVANPLLAVGGS